MSAQMNEEGLSHYRAVFDSPYLSSADIFDPVTLTIGRATQELDKTKKTKDKFNTVYFTEAEIRPGQKLKPMILNATNSKTLFKLTGSPFIEDWVGRRVVVYVETGIKFGRDTVDGLRIRPASERKELTPDNTQAWDNARAAYKRDGNLDKVLARMDISEANQAALIAECAPQEGAE